MKHRTLSALLLLGLLSAAGSPFLAHAQTTRGDQPPGLAGDELTGADADAALAQIKSTRDQLIEERRQALLQAGKAATPEAKLKILLGLQEAQKERRRQLRQLETRVRDALKAEKEKHRPAQGEGK
jgi:hypothetical protein